MMNTRSRARLQAETSAHDALNKEQMGIEFIENFSITRFGRLKEREIRSTKWACPTILNQLEFLSTLKHTVGNFYRNEQEF